ncbi:MULTISPECIES: helix-turn-helix transcriptional regulator [Bacillus amyloliquefaciens group]|uniref:helix-turn-helix domain-containing protein n=1 Tax=Bacillus amyloliquefaciens group TaxID=1938374 RepID=UPI002DFB7263|nr:helix-turn-helix transcriptional regulator [Bacillus amyloliquefaciens]
MNNFREDIKNIRIQKKIGSRKLSRLIGKAETYISQLERGLIKSPDYSTCFSIMKELGFAEDRIEEILADYYHIKSPERIAAEEAAAHRYAEEQEERLNDPDYLESQLSGQIEIIEKEKEIKSAFDNKPDIEDFERQTKYFQEEETVDQLKKEIFVLTAKIINKRLVTHYFIDSKGINEIANNLYDMLDTKNNEKNYDFLSQLFEFNYSIVSDSKKEKIIKAINEIINGQEDD